MAPSLHLSVAPQELRVHRPFPCSPRVARLTALYFWVDAFAPRELRVYRHSTSGFDALFAPRELRVYRHSTYGLMLLLPESCAFPGTLLMGLMLPPESCAFTGTLLLGSMLPFEFDAPHEWRVDRHRV